MREQIVALERRRCEAISGCSRPVLEEILAEDYVHVHGTGKIDDKAEFIANIMQRPRRVERGELTVRLYGDVAVVTGEQINYMLSADGVNATRSVNVVTQVLRHDGTRWRYVSFHLCVRAQ